MRIATRNEALLNGRHSVDNLCLEFEGNVGQEECLEPERFVVKLVTVLTFTRPSNSSR